MKKSKSEGDNKATKKSVKPAKEKSSKSGGGAATAQDGQTNMEHTTALQGAPGKGK